MTLRFDPTVKVMVDVSPEGWLALDGQQKAPTQPADAEIKLVLSGAADRFLRVLTEPQYLFHLDFQAGHDGAALPPRLQVYNDVADYSTGLPVRSVVVLLRPKADSPKLTGMRIRRLANGVRPHKVFRYGVIRVWQRSPAEMLASPGTLPLAPISDVGREELPSLIRVMNRRLRGEARAPDLWAATRVVMGLRYPEDEVDLLLRGIRAMRESSTYQAILAEGHAAGRDEGRDEGIAIGKGQAFREILLRMGEANCGRPSRAVVTAIEAITDLEQLNAMLLRVPGATRWDDILGQPVTRPRGRRRST